MEMEVEVPVQVLAPMVVIDPKIQPFALFHLHVDIIQGLTCSWFLFRNVYNIIELQFK
jgi:hypothetical protein